MPCPASGDGNRKWNVKWTLKKDDRKLEKKKSFKKVAHPECLPIYFQRKEKQCQVWRAVSSAARKFVVMDLSWVSESISACCTAVKNLPETKGPVEPRVWWRGVPAWKVPDKFLISKVLMIENCPAPVCASSLWRQMAKLRNAEMYCEELKVKFMLKDLKWSNSSSSTHLRFVPMKTNG